MSQLTPPRLPPAVSTCRDDDPLRRVHFRLWQISLAAVTVLVTGWFWSLGPAAGLTASFLAKHVLVAILTVGLDLPEPEPKK